MEVKVLENTKSKLTFEIQGESHSFCNILKQELWNDKTVKLSSYNIKHPLVGTPFFVVETTGEKSALNAVQDAVKRLIKDADKVKKASKEIK